MKSINKTLGITILMIVLFLGACTDILEEQPRTFFEPGFFKTEKGVQNGLTALYANLRYIYGQGYYYNSLQTGTDEATYGSDADANFRDHDLSGVGNPLRSTNSRSDVLWNATFSNLNTASGIIENGEAVGIAPVLIAEAYFFRAFDYFNLVQTFGGVPLDMGAGELRFNSAPSRTSVRNTVPEVYTKCIFPDLLKAVADLPINGRVKGGATKTLARLILAKAYLTYGWWLENPNNIPTYPDCPRTDPDGHDKNWYFQQAYNIAVEAIDNPGNFGLMPTFYEAHVGSNDRNKEMLLYADHTEANEFYNGGSLTYGGGGAPDNFAMWFMTWNYTVMQSRNGSGDVVAPIRRAATQDLGRPWMRMCPTINVFEETFSDKTNDSRYDGTFVSVYRANWPTEAPAITVLNNANNLPIYPGDPVLTFLPDDALLSSITYPSTEGQGGPDWGNAGLGKIPGRADFVVHQSGISRRVYPGLWKLGTYRTDNGSGIGQPNAGSTRPFNIAKFSELYLVAAEAVVKGATPVGGKSARDLINVLRARAGKWSFSNAEKVSKTDDFSAAMTAATPATIDINYILTERSRELYGEGYRWFDLVRTQTWTTKAGSYKICGAAYGNHTAETITRSITPHLYLRPIPQGQLDGMEMTDAEKAAYQNPGY